MEIDKLKSVEVEQIIIGCMLDEEGTRYQVLERVKEDDFYYPKHQVIFKTIKTVFRHEGISSTESATMEEFLGSK